MRSGAESLRRSGTTCAPGGGDVATKKKTKPKVKRKAKKPERLSPAQVVARRSKDERKRSDEKTVKDWEDEQRLREEYEREHEDLAPWIGFEEYQAARLSEARLRALGIVGAIMRGKKRTEIRRDYRISPSKLNAILNSELVDDIAANSIGHIYSMATAAQQAILHQLVIEKNGALAMALLEKLGIFLRGQKVLEGQANSGKEGETGEDVIALLFAKGENVQARQAISQIQQLVVDGLKSQEPDGIEPRAPRRSVQPRRVGD